MKEIESNIRELVIDALRLIASSELQMKYQKDVPNADVSSELFCTWEGAYIPESKINATAFSEKEIEVLNQFQLQFENIAKKTPQELPPIEEFIKTKEWLELSTAADFALKGLLSKIRKKKNNRLGFLT